MHISTAGVISWSISLIFGKMVDSGSMVWSLLSLFFSSSSFSRYMVSTDKILKFSVSENQELMKGLVW